MRPAQLALSAGVAFGLVMAACSQAAPAIVQTAVPTNAAAVGATPAPTGVEPQFNPTEGVGGGSNASSAVAEIGTILASVPQASQLKVSANSSPPGATGPDVQSISIVAQDPEGLLKGLDATAKKTLGDAILTAASTAFPNANVSLLVTAAAGGGQIIGSRPKGGPNTVFAT